MPAAFDRRTLTALAPGFTPSEEVGTPTPPPASPPQIARVFGTPVLNAFPVVCTFGYFSGLLIRRSSLVPCCASLCFVLYFVMLGGGVFRHYNY